MTDNLTKTERSALMARVRSKNTKPEIVVRRLTHAAGYRFRLHRRDLPGTPDLVFPSRRKVIFVHGCFWHGHTEATCRLARVPKSRRDFWISKVQYNRARDVANTRRLITSGWKSLVIWECELRNCAKVLWRITRFLGG